MRHRLIAFVAVLVVTVSAPVAEGQSTLAPPDDDAAFRAIIFTPAGALPQIVRVLRPMDSSSRGEIALRFGRYNFRNQSAAFNNFGVTGLWHFGRRIQAGGTLGQRSCSGCEGLRMGSVDVAASLFRKPASGDIGGDTDIGLHVSAGMGKAKTSDVTARSLTFSLPLAVSLPQAENSLLTLFLSPSLAYGRLSDTGVTNGTSLFMVGAGLGYSFAFGLGLHASAHRVVIEDSPTQFGFAMSWRFGGA